MIESRTYYNSDGKVTSDYRNRYYESGALEQNISTDKEMPLTTNYEYIGNGVNIRTGETGTCETNSNGDVVSITTTSANGKTQTTYSYDHYKPGIIKTETIKTTTSGSSGASTTTACREYNEDGWLIKYDYSGKENRTEYYTYESDKDGKSVIRCAFSDQALAKKNSSHRFVMNDSNCIIEVYLTGSDGKETLRSAITYEAITHSDKFPSALSRLKNG